MLARLFIRCGRARPASNSVRKVSFIIFQKSKGSFYCFKMNILSRRSIMGLFMRRTLYSTPKLRQEREISAQDDIPIEIENPFEKEKPLCILCKMKIEPDYKNVKLLSQFISPYTGRIYGRHITGLCRHKQERVETEINKAQRAAFMPYYNKEPEFLEDPKLFNPERPIRPHHY